MYNLFRSLNEPILELVDDQEFERLYGGVETLSVFQKLSLKTLAEPFCVVLAMQAEWHRSLKKEPEFSDIAPSQQLHFDENEISDLFGCLMNEIDTFQYLEQKAGQMKSLSHLHSDILSGGENGRENVSAKKLKRDLVLVKQPSFQSPFVIVQVD